MPELPEVEVCRLGITPHLLDKTVANLIVRNRSLRWPVPEEAEHMIGQTITAISRRAKYLLLSTPVGTLLMHLGMSGTIRIVEQNTPLKKHDHVDLVLNSGDVLRLNDPRRFGAVLWFTGDINNHELISHLGPEPLTDDFNEAYLLEKAKDKKVPIKTFLMNNKIVVGVGNIYANEALFQAQILPTTPAGKVSKAKLKKLVPIVKIVLAKAIEQGGTTLKDFTQSDGKPGYFAQELEVYGRAGKPCVHCKTLLTEIRIANRSTVFCSQCQR